MPEYTEIPVPKGSIFPLGQKVHGTHGLFEGDPGQVVRWARGTEAAGPFAGVDGPVVRFEIGAERWYPGEAMDLLERVSSS